MGLFDPVRHLPDHNVLQWEMDIAHFVNIKPAHKEDISAATAVYYKYDVSTIPADMLGNPDIQQLLQETINRIESEIITQQDLDGMYDKFCDIIVHEMNDKLEKKTINVNSDLCDKRRKIKKDYWNEELDRLYKDFRKADKDWARAKGEQRRKLKSEKCVRQRNLDRAVQRAKREHWRKMQEEILALQDDSGKEFWKYVGKIGVSNDRKGKIPWEVVLPDGTVSRDHQVVLDHWRSEFRD